MDFTNHHLITDEYIRKIFTLNGDDLTIRWKARGPEFANNTSFNRDYANKPATIRVENYRDCIKHYDYFIPCDHIIRVLSQSTQAPPKFCVLLETGSETERTFFRTIQDASTFAARLIERSRLPVRITVEPWEAPNLHPIDDLSHTEYTRAA